MTRLLLVRHGETTWNDQARYQGHTDVPLSPRGWVEAELLARGGGGAGRGGRRGRGGGRPAAPGGRG